jgi:uncharacterized membrane protein YfcA
LAQSTVGFGYALYATPLLVWIGIPLQNTIALVATCAMIQSVFGVQKLRASVPWRLVFTGTVIRMIAFLVGLCLLKRLVAASTEQIRMVVGLILCFLVMMLLLWQPRPVEKMHPAWDGLAFSASGLLAGVCGFGGPPLALWSMAHSWSTHKTRGFLFAAFAINIPIQTFFMYLAFGTTILWSVAIAIAFMPLVYLGSVIGLPIGNRLPKKTLRHIAYAILLVIGISAAAPPLLTYLR